MYSRHWNDILMGVAPLLIWPEHLPAGLPLDSIGGPRGPNAQFLKDFGKTLVEKYNPKAIVVFSAHWETHGHIEGNYVHKEHISDQSHEL
jgi:aromatic ring-opening dioxygenase catalytic subunit (LigB family)